MKVLDCNPYGRFELRRRIIQHCCSRVFMDAVQTIFVRFMDYTVSCDRDEVELDFDPILYRRLPLAGD